MLGITYDGVRSGKCAVRENIHTHTEEGHWNSEGKGGSQKPKFLKETLKQNWNIQSGGG